MDSSNLELVSTWSKQFDFKFIDIDPDNMGTDSQKYKIDAETQMFVEVRNNSTEEEDVDLVVYVRFATSSTRNLMCSVTILFDPYWDERSHGSNPLIIGAASMLPDQDFEEVCDLILEGDNKLMIIATMTEFELPNPPCLLFSDFTFTVDDEDFPVHKAILAARSPVFSKMFTVDLKERKSNKVTLKNVSKDVFKNFLKFLYTGETGDIDIELLKFADKYQVADLKTAYESTMLKNLSSENAADVFQRAHRHHLPGELKKAAFDLINATLAAVNRKMPDDFVDKPEAVKDLLDKKRTFEEAFGAQ